MASSDFRLTAQLILAGPTNLAQISKKLSALQIPASSQASANKFSSSLQSVNKAASKAVTSVQSLNKNLGKMQGNLKNTSTNMGKVRGNTVQAVGGLENFGRTLGFVTTRLIGFRIASGLVIGFGGAIRSAVGEAIDFERQLIKVAQVTDREINQLGRLTAEITRLSIATGTASKDLITVSKTLSQAGLSADNTRIALEALAKSTLLPTFGDIAQTTEGAIAIFNQFGLEAKDLFGILSSIDSVTGSLAVEASDVTVAVKKAGGVFAALSRDVVSGEQAFREFLAIFAAVRQTTRESAQNIAVGLRTIFARIQRPRTIEFLKELGIEIQNTTDRAGELLRPFEVIQNIAAATAGLSALDPKFLFKD